MTSLWLTRTLPAAEESAKAWRAAGYEVLIDPLLQIEAITHDPLPKDAVLIFTSKNGVDHTHCSGQRAICVGDATAEKARAAGYQDVVSVNGTWADVTAWAAAHIPKTQPIIHVSGWHVRGRIVEDLSAAGHDAQRIKIYRSVPKSIWPEHPFTSVVFYSPLAAKVFFELVLEWCKDVSQLTAICISEATADELSGLALETILIAKHPREDELIMAAKLTPPSALEV